LICLKWKLKEIRKWLIVLEPSLITNRCYIDLNGELQIEGNFNFELSPIIITEDLIPIKKITFDWCVEISQAEMMTFGEDKIFEMFGERLKQDFIKRTKQK